MDDPLVAWHAALACNDIIPREFVWDGDRPCLVTWRPAAGTVWATPAGDVDLELRLSGINDQYLELNVCEPWSRLALVKVVEQDGRIVPPADVLSTLREVCATPPHRLTSHLRKV